MIQYRKFRAILMALMLVTGMSAFSATKIAIPTPNGEYIDLSMADVVSANVEGSVGPDQCYGSTGSNTKVTFLLENTVAQPYTFIMSTGHKGDCYINWNLKNAEGTTVQSERIHVANTKGWGRSLNHRIFIDQLAVGDYTLELTPSDLTESSYAGNWGKMAFLAGIVDDRDHIPGPIALGNGNYIGMRTENNDGNVGYIKDNTSATYTVVCDQAGVYDFNWGITRYGDGVATITVTDANGNETVNTKWAVENLSNYAPATVHLEGEIAKGENTVKVLFNASHGGFIANFNNVSMARIADHYACVRNVAVDGQTVTEGEGYDLNCNLPMNFSGSTVDFTLEHPNSTIAVTAKKGEADVAVTEAGDKYSFAAPAANEEVIVTMTITPNEGNVVAYKTVYTMRVFHIGEIILSKLTVDGNDIDQTVFDALSAEPYTYNWDCVFTHMPVITAKFMHGQEVTATASKLNGTKVDYTFTAKTGDKERSYKLSIDGIHLYDRLSTDETVQMLYSQGTYDGDTKTWTNGQFSISGIDGGWNDEFKFPIAGEATYTINVAPDAVVKQFIFKGFRDNYTNNTNMITAVTSEGATAWIPGDNRFYNTSEAGDRDLVVNIEGHQVGKPISFTIKSNGQMMSKFEFTVGREAITSAPVLYASSTVVPANANHFVGVAKFDRVIKSAKATVGDQTINAKGGSDVVYFPAWNLEYGKEYEMTVTEAVDNYGNNIAAPYVIKATTGEKLAAQKAEIDHIVSNVEEFKAALAAVNQSNKDAGAPAAVIFVKNGDYDFGGDEQTFRCHNVALIGESRDGVILHGNRSGISNPVISTRYASDIYMQDLTIRNDYDWGKPRNGVGVAISNGNRDVAVNVSFQSQQDTQVTNGNQGYYLGCDFYGAVDYVCGGGNQFYDKCNFFMTADGTIVAPSTSAQHKWGYVFSSCVVDEATPGALVNGWTMCRPWQNEPRAYWINTTMVISPSGNGYAGMGKHPTHFYEYGSMDADGNLLDLSGRGNSSDHVGEPYVPVLTDEEAAFFTVENVLGQTDSYSVAEVAARPEAPVVTLESAPASRAAGDMISWNEVPDARYYAVYHEGRYIGNTTETTFPAENDGLYQVRAANARGGLGEASQGVVLGTTGLESIGTDSEAAAVEYYNLQGVRVSDNARGIVIKVTVNANGRRTAEKIVK